MSKNLQAITTENFDFVRLKKIELHRNMDEQMYITKISRATF